MGTHKEVVGNLGPMPDELKRWNWGAFLLNVIWGIGNKTFIAFLCFIPWVGMVMPIVLGIKGNEWAWKNKNWDSTEQFEETQRKWAKWGVIFIIAMVLLAGGMILAVESLMKSSDVYKESFSMIRQNDEIVGSIGQPIKSGWMVSGSIETTNSTGKAEINYSIKGPKGFGKVEVEGGRNFDKWNVNKIRVKVNDQDEVINVPTSKEKKL